MQFGSACGSQRRLQLSDGLRPRLQEHPLLRDFTDHLQGRGLALGAALLVGARVLLVCGAAAQFGGALSPAGQLAQGVPRLRVEGDKLGLDGGGVDALVVEEVLDPLGHVHVRRGVVALDVGGGDDPAARQLPDVQLVDGQHAVQAQQPLVEPVHVDLLGHGLQQDESGLLEQRVGCVQQDPYHDDAERGVEVENPAGAGEGLWKPFRQVHQRLVDMHVVCAMAPDAGITAFLIIFTGLPHKGEYEGVDHNDDGAQSVTQHVEEDPTHVELGRRRVLVVQLVVAGAAVQLQILTVLTDYF